MAQAKENMGELERLGSGSLSVKMEPKGMKELAKKHSPRSHKHARTEKRARKR